MSDATAGEDHMDAIDQAMEEARACDSHDSLPRDSVVREGADRSVANEPSFAIDYPGCAACRGIVANAVLVAARDRYVWLRAVPTAVLREWTELPYGAIHQELERREREETP